MGTTRRRRLCRIRAGKRAARARTSSDPQGDGAAHVRVPRPFDQASPDGDSFVRLPARRCAPGRDRSRSPPPAVMCRFSISHPWRRWKPISSRSRSGSWERPICGAESPVSASTARDWCSLRSPPAAFPVRATATCRSRHWAARSHGRATASNCGAAISCSGRATSPSCGTRRRSCMPTSHHMAVAFEDSAAAIARIRAIAGEVTSVRRLPPASGSQLTKR